MYTDLKQTFRHLRQKNAQRMAAALSYYAMLSVIPLLYLVVTLSNIFFNKARVDQALDNYLLTTLGKSLTDFITNLLSSISVSDIGILGAVLTGLIIIFASLGVFRELKKAINELWNSKDVEQDGLMKLKSFYKKSVISFSLIPILAVLLGFSILTSIGLTTLEAQVKIFDSLRFIIKFAHLFVPFVLGMILFVVIYRIMPRYVLPWKILFRGALFTAILFLFGNLLISFYLQAIVQFHRLGSATTLIGLLIWLYYSSLVFFFGASYTYIYAKNKGIIFSRER